MSLSFIAPQLASPVAKLPTGPNWLHELKLDGYRFQLHLFDGTVQLFTRNGHDWTARYAELATSIAMSATRKKFRHGVIFDGELVALDQAGKSDFSALQDTSGKLPAPSALVFFAFDLLHLDGADTLGLALIDRKLQLQKIVRQLANDKLQYLDHVVGTADSLLEQVSERGLEGIISKRMDRPYKSGRSSDWLKLKLRHREQFVIGGYEVGETNPGQLSSLLVGYFDGPALIFAGRVGTGFSESVSKQLLDRLARRLADSSPFSESLPKATRFGNERRAVHWVSPEQHVEVAFAGWTGGTILRQASFMGLVAGSPRTASKQLVFRDSKPDKTKSSDAGSKPMSTSGQLRITHPDKVIFDKQSITKEQILRHTVQISQWILPHLQDRPTSFVCCPNGIDGPHHFRKHPQKGFPNQLGRFEHEGKELLSVDNVDALMAMIQISAIEFHPWGCRADRMDRPDRMVLDLDPDTTVLWSAVIEAAMNIRQLLEDVGLQSWVKTTGGKGLHLVVPLSRRHTWEQMFSFSKQFAEQCTNRWPKDFVSTMAKKARVGRIFIDYHRNREGATAVGAYSLRARDGAAISTPVAWDELSDIRSSQEFTMQNLASRLRNLTQDPWEGIAGVKQSLGR